MSDTKQTKSDTKGGPQYRITGEGAWSHAWKVAAAAGVIGLIASGVGYHADPRRFAFSWLFAFFTVLTTALGCLFFVVLQHLVSAGWSVTVRRTAEFFAIGLPVLALLFIPVYALRTELYPWLAESAEVSATHHAPEANERELNAPPATPQETAEHAVLVSKNGYLNERFWTLRAVGYFAIWTILAFLYFTRSTRQDSTKDPSLTVKSQNLAPAATILFALTITFAAFDWVMSLEPGWYSTIFGVYIFGGATVSMFSLLTVVTMSLRSSGLLGDAVNTEHFHDLGKLAFGFNVFWAYIGFSQMMLIWYANIPEETAFYHLRWDASGWKTISILILFGHFIAPFMMLISRNAKRRLTILGFGTAWLLTMHVVDIYWFVMPNYHVNDFAPNMLDFSCLLAVGGIYLAVVFQRMTSHALIPRGDPRLERALHFENA